MYEDKEILALAKRIENFFYRLGYYNLPLRDRTAWLVCDNRKENAEVLYWSLMNDDRQNFLDCFIRNTDSLSEDNELVNIKREIINSIKALIIQRA